MKDFSIDVTQYSGFIEMERDKDKEEISVPALQNYYELQKRKEVFDIAFAQQDWNLGLWKKDGDIEIFLPNEELGDGNAYLERQGALKRRFSVVVYNIDEQAKRVYVSLKRAQEKVRPAVIAQIEVAIASDTYFYAQAKIVYIAKKDVGKRFCILDIMGLGIQGIMSVGDWSHEYLSDLNNVTKVGAVIPVAIIGRTKMWKREVPQYQCSRKATLDAPQVQNKWENVEVDFPIHSRVSVRCVKRYEKSFLGQILGRNNWYVYCLYPDKEKHPGVNVLEDGCYRGYVVSVSSEKQILRIKVIEQIPDSVSSMI